MIGIDMKMPKTCDECQLADKIGTAYYACPFLHTAIPTGHKGGKCPLHELPDDGKIRVGDEVRNNIVGCNGIVTFVWVDGSVDVVITENGRAIQWGKGDVERTGRHFDEVEALLRKMRGEDDG